ncbi:hypothetical protein ACI39V_27640, partial [Klebsiella pneumoniae]
ILAKSGVEVWVEAGAGAASFATDEQYQAKGIKVTTSADIFSNATVLLSFNPLPETAYTAVRSNTVLVGVYQPLFNISLAQQIAHRGLSLFSL